MATAFPAHAMSFDKPGEVTLRCRVDGEGYLTACSVASESAEGYKFDDAALALAGKYRLRPVTAAGESVAGALVTLPMQFIPES